MFGKPEPLPKEFLEGEEPFKIYTHVDRIITTSTDNGAVIWNAHRKDPFDRFPKLEGPSPNSRTTSALEDLQPTTGNRHSLTIQAMKHGRGSGRHSHARCMP